MHARGPFLGLALALALTGCGDDGDRVVPFGLGDPAPPPASSDPPPTSEAESAAEWPEGSEVRVEGTPIAVPDAQVRATLPLDLDADGDRDVVLVAISVDGSVSLATAARSTEGLAFRPPVTLAAACAPTTLGSARLVSFSSDLVAVRLERTCGGASEQRVTLVRVAPAARVLSTLVLAPLAGETITVRAEDRDDDGHADVVLHVSLHEPGGESADVDLAWLDRAAGLSRDTAEPEATIAARATEARTALRRHPDRALAAARTAILVHDALCGTTARLAVDDDPGLACPTSAGLGRALAVTAAAEARQGHLAEALEALAGLARSDASVRDVDRTTAREALAGMSGVLRPATNEGPEARAVGGDGSRLSTLAFLDEDRVLVRGDRARVITLSSGEAEPAVDGETAMADASRGHVLAEIERGCEGYVLVVRPLFGPLDSPSDARTTALVEAAPPPAGAACGSPGTDAALPLVQRQDAGGWRALGWAPQGALVARGRTLVLVPLDVAGASLGTPQPLADDEPAPAPITAGNATVDASAWAFATEVGLLLQRRGAEPVLVVPEGFTRADGAPIDVAVSPSAQRLAWIESGHLRWVDTSISPSPPTSPPPPPPPSTSP